MDIVDKAKKAKALASMATIPRIIATFAGGTLGQRATMVLGLGFIGVGVYMLITSSIVPFIVCAVGGVLVWLSLSDYERMRRYRDP